MAFDLVAKSSTTVTNTTTETSLLPATVNIPGGEPQAGFTCRLKLMGILTTDVVAPTLRFRVYIGAVQVGDTGAFTLPLLVTGVPWDLEFLLTFSSSGAAATYQAGGRVLIPGTTAVISAADMIYLAWVVTTANLTSNNALDVKATWGTASANNLIRCDVATIESTTV